MSLTALQSVGGSIVIRNNAVLETFGASPTAFTTIGGNLEFSNTAIQDVDGLAGVTSVGGDIVFNQNASMTSLTGLEQLISAASLSIIDNDNALFTDLNELINLTTLDNTLTITGNGSLSDCSQLPCQVTVGGEPFNTVNNANVTVSGNTGNCTNKQAIQDDPAVNSRECVQVALPVELLAFSGALDGSTVNLTWSTATETDNSHFFVERSVDGLTYAAIGRVEGAGTVGLVTDYAYTDEAFTAGVNYYRLRQVDFDGAESLSNVIAIDASTLVNALGIFPNPVSAGDLMTISAGTLTKGHTLTAEVFSAAGRLVGKQSWNSGDKLQLPTAGFAPGLYVVRLNSGGRSVTERVVVR